MWIFNPIQNSDKKYDEVVLRIPELFSVTPACAIRCWECRSEWIHVTSAKVVQNKGNPSSGNFPARSSTAWKWSGLQWKIPSSPELGTMEWPRTLGMANTSCKYPRALALLSYPEVVLLMVGLVIFFFFNLPVTFLLLSLGVLFGTKPFQMENQTADESHTHPEP